MQWDKKRETKAGRGSAGGNIRLRYQTDTRLILVNVRVRASGQRLSMYGQDWGADIRDSGE